MVKMPYFLVYNHFIKNLGKELQQQYVTVLPSGPSFLKEIKLGKKGALYTGKYGSC